MFVLLALPAFLTSVFFFPFLPKIKGGLSHPGPSPRFTTVIRWFYRKYCTVCASCITVLFPFVSHRILN